MRHATSVSQKALFKLRLPNTSNSTPLLSKTPYVALFAGPPLRTASNLGLTERLPLSAVDPNLLRYNHRYVLAPPLRYHSPVPDDPQKNNPWVQLARYSQLAVVFPAATVVGWLIGAGLDRWLHTTWLYIVGVILGSIAGFVELIRAASKNSNVG